MQVIPPEEFGVIIDNQGVDESTPGTTGGAVLGSALAQTTYIDRAFKGGSYSATNQLGLAILGAVVGSSLDSKSVQQYHFRYAVRLSSGEVKYADHIQGTAFRHPNGICVAYPNIAPTDEGLCSHTPVTFRAKYLQEVALRPTINGLSNIANEQPMPSKGLYVGSSDSTQVICKIGAQSPVTTTEKQCNLIGGSVIQ